MTQCDGCSGEFDRHMASKTRAQLLQQLIAGDIFHARAPNGASLLCLITKVDESVIEARRVTTQEGLRFDRKTGFEVGEGNKNSVIDSIAPLPPDVYNVILGLDRRYRLAQDVADFKLTAAENKAFSFLDTFHSTKPLRAAEPL